MTVLENTASMVTWGDEAVAVDRWRGKCNGIPHRDATKTRLHNSHL